MASDRKVFEKASRRWHDLHDRGQYSRDPDEGYVAIAYSNWETPQIEDEGTERAAFRSDAEAVSHFLEYKLDLHAHIFPDVDRQRMLNILADRAITSVITIGNGSVSALWTDLAGEKDIDWRFIAKNTDHLKRGFFHQRQCGIFTDELSVPLGTFALASQSMVFAAPNEALPTEIPVIDNRIVRLHTRDELDYDSVKQLFPQNIRKNIDDIVLPTAASATATTSSG